MAGLKSNVHSQQLPNPSFNKELKFKRASSSMEGELNENDNTIIINSKYMKNGERKEVLNNFHQITSQK